MKNLKVFNMILLEKWKLRLVKEDIRVIKRYSKFKLGILKSLE